MGEPVAFPGVNLLGLALNIVGSILLGAGGVKGLAAGFGGPIAWQVAWWRASWLLGWLLLALGFALQWIAAYLALAIQTVRP